MLTAIFADMAVVRLAPRAAQYVCAVGENMILVDDRHQRGEPAFAEGAELSLSLASEQVVLLSE